MSPARLLTVLSLVLLLAGVWTGPVTAQPQPDAPDNVEVLHTEVPRAVVPDRIPVVPSPASSVRLLPERLDGRPALSLAAPAGRPFAPAIWTTGVPPEGRTRLYDVLRVYRL